MTEKKKSSYFKSMIVAVIALIVVVGILMLFGALRLPAWPFLILLVICVEVYALGTEKYWQTVLTGAVGLIMGFLQNILGAAGIPASVVGIVFIVALIFFLALDIEKSRFVSTALCMVNMNIVLNVPGVAAAENIIPVFLAYGLGVAVVAVFIYALRAVAMKAAGKAGAGKP